LNHSFSTPQPTKLAANVLLDTSGHLHGVNALAASFLAAFGRKVIMFGSFLSNQSESSNQQPVV